MGLFGRGNGSSRVGKTVAVVAVAAMVLAAAGALVGILVRGSAATGGSGGARAAGQRTGVAARVPGWQPVLSADGGLAYEVPADWRVRPRGSSSTLSDRRGHRIPFIQRAVFGAGYCPQRPGADRAHSGVTSLRVADPSRAATEAAREIAALALGGGSGGSAAQVRLSAPAQVSVQGYPGTEVHATVSLSDADTCDRTGRVDVMAFGSAESGASLILSVVSRGDAVPRRQADRILTSLRRTAGRPGTGG